MLLFGKCNHFYLKFDTTFFYCYNLENVTRFISLKWYFNYLRVKCMFNNYTLYGMVVLTLFRKWLHIWNILQSDWITVKNNTNARLNIIIFQRKILLIWFIFLRCVPLKMQLNIFHLKKLLNAKAKIIRLVDFIEKENVL